MLAYAAECKEAGRMVKNFVQEVWTKHILTIAYEVVVQKFSQLKHERNILLSTNDGLIVEASPTDKIWGVGAHRTDPSVQDPKLWRGTNILGWALMEARSTLTKNKTQNSAASIIANQAANGDVIGVKGSACDEDDQIKTIKDKEESNSRNLKAKDLMQYWKSIKSVSKQQPVIGFYGHSKGTYVSFSNFYQHQPTTFTIPDCCWSEEFEERHSKTVENITFAEKSIMLCKAALFRDHEAFEHIQVSTYMLHTIYFFVTMCYKHTNIHRICTSPSHFHFQPFSSFLFFL
jgi:hypothetical protein